MTKGLPHQAALQRRARRLLRNLSCVGLSALALGATLELWQTSMNQRFAVQAGQWLQGAPDPHDDVDLPPDPQERALLRGLRQNGQATQLVGVHAWSRGGWLIVCTPEPKAYILGFAVHVHGGRIIDVTSTDPATCGRPVAASGPANR